MSTLHYLLYTPPKHSTTSTSPQLSYAHSCGLTSRCLPNRNLGISEYPTILRTTTRHTHRPASRLRRPIARRASSGPLVLPGHHNHNTRVSARHLSGLLATSTPTITSSTRRSLNLLTVARTTFVRREKARNDQGLLVLSTFLRSLIFTLSSFQVHFSFVRLPLQSLLSNPLQNFHLQEDIPTLEARSEGLSTSRSNRESGEWSFRPID